MLQIFALSQDFKTFRNSPDDTMLVGMYLHGWLEEASGFDLCCVGDPQFLVDCGPGIYPCETIFCGGYAVESLLFLWSSFGFSHGLVVDKNDAEGVRYALESFIKRKPIL